MASVITLTTDFGAAGPYVGIVKAVILRHAPAATIVDLTHQVAPYHPGEAGFWLANAYRQFAPGSVHVAVVDPGVGTSRAILACAFDGHYFLAPDNGILPMITASDTPIHALSQEWLARQSWPPAGNTFHGRDIFAPLAAAILTGQARPADIGPRMTQPTPAPLPLARRESGRIAGCVAAIDTWGNLITNIGTDLLEGLRQPVVGVGQRDLRLITTYGAAPPGALLALINSFGTVEIAWREGNAAQMLGLQHGAPVTVMESTKET